MAILQLGKSLKARLQDWKQAVKLRPGSNDKGMKVNADKAKRDRYMTKQGKQPKTTTPPPKKKKKRRRRRKRRRGNRTTARTISDGGGRFSVEVGQEEEIGKDFLIIFIIIFLLTFFNAQTAITVI